MIDERERGNGSKRENKTVSRHIESSQWKLSAKLFLSVVRRYIAGARAGAGRVA